MHWSLEPIIWVLIVGTLALLAIPRPTHPAPREASPSAVRDASPEIRRACDGDVRRLCPKEYAAEDRTAIRTCMCAHRLEVSARCAAAWIKEHPKQIIGACE